MLKTSGIYYGEFGGRYVPDHLDKKLEILEDVFKEIKNDPVFISEYQYYLKNYVGRPSALYYAKNLSKIIGVKTYLKREDLNHTGAHKINNAIGQILIAKRMGKKEIIAETGAGQHGVATATAAALFNMKCKIFMGEEDINRQKMNVERMKILGAEIIPATNGTKTLKEAVDKALEYYVDNPESYYLLGSAVGPSPYPEMVKFFQSVIGQEAKKQFFDFEGELPDGIFACIGGGSNSIGIFNDFIKDEVKLYAAEGGGEGINSGRTAATLSSKSQPIIFQGSFSYCLTDQESNPIEAYSISAGLDYPGIGPEHAFFKESNRIMYYPINDDEAIESFKILSKEEGIIPAIESAHAIALAKKIAKVEGLKKIIVNLSGRGDKDVGRFL
ncbi:tryptophan synthase subunit beta [Geotoga petraea]|uniref:Tryptophan synthase beta chain n=1 Tax=Geotoga petraea TaxID=28234 RepID=A0A1G6JPL1_9BACT|nr:tryptophan synthase subunit beta [Geotoga petraea]SDC20618.1 tryptophan synthase beta chain [Geotoga petraea]